VTVSRFCRRLVAALLCATLAATAAQAADVPWRKEKFSYMTRGQSLRDFLRHFGSSQGLTVVVDPAVEGSVVGNYNMTPQNVMSMLEAQHGLIWYYDGNILYVYPSGQAQSQTIRLNYGTVAQFRQTLVKLNIPDKRFPITYDKDTNTALVGGPKRYVDLINEVAHSIDQKEGSGGTTDIQVFPLKYAWAADYTFTQGGREYKLPGVATVLRNLYQTNGAAARNVGLSSGRRSGSTVDKLRGLGLAAGDSPNAGNNPAPPTAREPIEITAGSSIGGVGAAQQGLPQFQADGRLNAVVVRDTPERMAFYERVIRQLDIRPSLVEIEARIIEISSDKAKSLGVDWRVQTPRFDVQSGMLPLTPDNVLGRGGSNLPAVAGGVFATRLTDAGRQLLARVNALAKDGHANVLSSPRIMTLDNVEAVVENLNNFFVRVAGNLDVDLFNVSAGTSLRVTPLIVPEGNQTLIKMAIKIEDGTVTSQQVDSIPVVRRTNIGTQAFIANGESLLIAGFSQTSESSNQAAVPGVSQVPVFGRLFKYEETKKQRVERMFLLTPRVVPLPGGVGQ
jgi:type III secretion protein C